MEYTLKKSLGQHFLRDEQVCKRIMAALLEDPVERVLEIGPGGGALTKYLLQQEQVTLLCVELDREKVEWLQTTFPVLQGKIIHQSFLEMPLPFAQPFTIIGNFPYNISSQILFRVLEWKERVPLVIGMFQKEVAQRVASQPGNKVYGVLSVLVQAFYDVQFLFEVNEQCFQPPPKVKSAVIRLRRKATLVDFRSENDFFRLVKMAFNQRRKTLRNALRSLFTADELTDPVFDLRAEQLTIDQFAQLTHKMHS